MVHSFYNAKKAHPVCGLHVSDSRENWIEAAAWENETASGEPQAKGMQA